MPRLFCACLLLAGFAAGPVVAQSTGVPAQSLIRMRVVGESGWTRGTFVRSSVDSLYLATADGGVAVAQSNVTRIEVSRGRKANTMGGLKNGALIGAGAGAVIGLLAMEEQESSMFDYGAEVIPISLAGGAALGALIGMGVGSLMRTDRWQRANTAAPRVAVLLVPGPELSRIGLVIDF